MELLRNVTIGQYVPGDSPVHRLDPRVKMMLLTLLVVEIFLLQKWLDALIPGLFLLLVVVISRLPLGFVLRGLRSIFALVLITFVFNILFTAGTPLVSFGGITISQEGMSFGILMSLRLILIVFATSILTLSTSPIQITDGLESLMKWGKVIKLPVHEIAMMMSIALRFIPTLMEQLEKIIKAQMARGADFERGSLVKKVKSFIPVLVPLFVQAFKHADDLAVAMEARCYRGGEGRTRLKVLRVGAIDLCAVIITGIFCILLSWIDTMNFF